MNSLKFENINTNLFKIIHNFDIYKSKSSDNLKDNDPLISKAILNENQKIDLLYIKVYKIFL